MKKIVIFSLESIANGGDQMLGDTTEFLISDANDVKISRAQLMPRDTQFVKDNYLKVAISHIAFSIAEKLPDFFKYRLYNWGYKFRYSSYYKSVISKADKIIFGIGMLKYSTQDFSYMFECINKIATKMNVPVLMSAMSVEKPIESDYRFRQVVRAVNYPCVKAITTRDGQKGLDRLRKHYIKRDSLKSDFVGDPALWAPECYGIRKGSLHTPAKLGIGLVRTDIYEDYKNDVSKEQLENMYRELIRLVIEDGRFDFYLFCNGMERDIEFGRQLIKEFNLPESKLLEKPKTAKELLELVSGFDLVFGARLHACITSVSLGVPVSGLLWDNKLDYFSETMGIRDYFNDAPEVNGRCVYAKLKAAFEHPLDCDNRNNYKEKTKNSLQQFVQNS